MKCDARGLHLLVKNEILYHLSASFKAFVFAIASSIYIAAVVVATIYVIQSVSQSAILDCS